MERTHAIGFGLVLAALSCGIVAGITTQFLVLYGQGCFGAGIPTNGFVVVTSTCTPVAGTAVLATLVAGTIAFGALLVTGVAFLSLGNRQRSRPDSIPRRGGVAAAVGSTEPSPTRRGSRRS